MKKLICLLISVSLLFLVGCAHSKAERRTSRVNKRYPGWEQVRIEKEVPQKNCEYKIQKACSQPGGKCYDFFKQNATTYGANVVVITDLGRGQRSSGYTSVYNGAGGGGFSSVDSMTALADFYYCPGYKFGEQKQDSSK